MSAIICQDGNHPYLNNPYASLASQSQITYEGKFYTKLAYKLQIGAAARLIKIIQVIALVIFSCFIALAFQSMRKLWFDGIKGSESVDVFISQVFSECRDTWMLIGSNLSVRDLLVMRTTSSHKKIIADKTLINHLNSGKITLSDMRISTVTGLIDFFGDNCSQIIRLNLEEFIQITDSDIENLSKHFTNLNYLLLKDIAVTNESATHFAKMIMLTSLDLSGCRQINDISFLKHLEELTSLNLSECDQINDFSFLEHCKVLKSLDLSMCIQINDFSFLEHLKELTSLNLSMCVQINDIGFLQHCKKLTRLDLSECDQINNMNFLQDCRALTSLVFAKCDQIFDISFLKHFNDLTSLDLSMCDQITDFSVLLDCKALTTLNFSWCRQLNDMSFLQDCKELRSLTLSWCDQINDFSFLEHCQGLTSLDLSECDQINDISFLVHCKGLTSLNLSMCKQIKDISFLQHCKELKSLNLLWCRQINDISVQFLRNRGVIVKL